MRYRRLAPAALAVPALLLAACGSNGPSNAAGSMSAPTMASSSSPAGTTTSSNSVAMLEKVKTSTGKLVLADSKGYTLYWYSKDTSMASNCTAACATAWPPVMGKPEAAQGVILTGPLSTITRPGGGLQAVYEGHELYLYSGDTGPGQISGNGLEGVWHVLKVQDTGTVTSIPAGGMSTPTGSSTGSGGGGYGY